VLQQPQQQHDQFNYSLPAGMYFQPQQLPPQQATAVSSWAHHNVLRYQVQQQQQQKQQDIGGGGGGGPQSLDSQWISHQQQADIAIRTDHPAALTRKLSTYGTLPRNRQRRFFLAAQKQQRQQGKFITIHATSNRQNYRDKIRICRSSIHLRLSYCILFPTALFFLFRIAQLTACTYYHFNSHLK
jgi:hypothetical protein